MPTNLITSTRSGPKFAAHFSHWRKRYESIKKLVIATFLLFVTSSVLASKYCGELEESREWFESKVSTEAADRALEKLSASNESAIGVDFVVAENALRVVEAQMHLKFIEASVESFGEADAVLINMYCEFLESRGYFTD
ncbi:hypothetical protein [Reinekea sp. G2M2-21]|uniref:hypothetical protein n=1 Tax=Reinekea sp. G2M2-21 TaxID=2788942 RepID=UPI0018AA4F71|nr:hypothetical protein [Reinekea sp. G2M2-21]